MEDSVSSPPTLPGETAGGEPKQARHWAEQCDDPHKQYVAIQQGRDIPLQGLRRPAPQPSVYKGEFVYIVVFIPVYIIAHYFQAKYFQIFPNYSKKTFPKFSRNSFALFPLGENSKNFRTTLAHLYLRFTVNQPHSSFAPIVASTSKRLC